MYYHNDIRYIYIYICLKLFEYLFTDICWKQLVCNHCQRISVVLFRRARCRPCLRGPADCLNALGTSMEIFANACKCCQKKISSTWESKAKATSMLHVGLLCDAAAKLNGTFLELPKAVNVLTKTPAWLHCPWACFLPTFNRQFVNLT